jgi:hypothetical protein
MRAWKVTAPLVAFIPLVRTGLIVWIQTEHSTPLPGLLFGSCWFTVSNRPVPRA